VSSLAEKINSLNDTERQTDAKGIEFIKISAEKISEIHVLMRSVVAARHKLPGTPGEPPR
jgi:hypothetical protein